MNNNIAYKLVSIDNGQYKSYFSGNPHRITYNKHSPVFPYLEDSFLYVFDSYDHAKKYFRNGLFNPDGEIWEVDCVNLKYVLNHQIAFAIFLHIGTKPPRTKS